MGFVDVFKNPWFARIVFALFLVSSLSMLYLLNTIDTIVNNQLYSFGLRFSLLWANPYWNALHLIYALLAIPAVLSAVGLIASFVKPKDRMMIRHVDDRPRARASSKRAVLYKCKHCGKTFSNPETRAFLKGGRVRSFYVCPFCHRTLAEQMKRPDDGIQLEPNFEELVRSEKVAP